MIGRALVPALPLIVVALWFRGLGAYPANDDFLFARSAQHWAEEDRFLLVSLNGYLTPSAVVHVATGWLAAEAFGFSFLTLRWATLTVCACGGVALYSLARTVGCGRGVACLIATALVVNPFYFGHAFTFMTDAPAVAWASVALSCYVRGSLYGSCRWLFVGSIATLLGVWTRQTDIAILVFPTYFVGAEAFARRQWFASLKPWSAACLVPVIGLLAFLLGVFDTGTVDQDFPGLTRRLDGAWLRRAAIDGYGVCLLTAFAILPLAPLLATRLADRLRHRSRGRRRMLAGVGFAVVAALSGALYSTHGEAYLTNGGGTGPFLQNAHFGPILLSDSYDPGRWSDMGNVVWPAAIWQAISLMAILATGLMAAVAVDEVAELFDRPADGSLRSRWSMGALLTAGVTCFGLLLLIEKRFDRYWMALFAPVFAWTAVRVAQRSASAGPGRQWRIPVWASIASTTLLAATLAMSIVFTHDYLAWNQARWRLVEEYRARGFDPDQIDGGYEVNGWFRSAADPATKDRPEDAGHPWWGGNSVRWIAGAPRDGFRTIDRSEWRSWATGRTHSIYGLSRGELTTPGP